MGVGLRTALRLFRDPLVAGDNTATADIVMLPSWTGGDKAQSASLPPGIAEAFGLYMGSEKVTRTQAMKVPAVKRGRTIIAGTLGAAPLVGTRSRAGKAPERIDRPFLKNPNPACTPAFTYTWTIDSLIFYGVSYWRVLTRDTNNFPLTAEWVHPGRYRIDLSDGKFYVDNVEVPSKDLIRFDGPDEGILELGSQAIQTYMQLNAAVKKFSRLDIPLGYIADEMGNLTPTEITEMLDSWEAAMASRTTAYLPQGWKYNNPSFNAQQMQLNEILGAQAQDLARLMNLPASYINAPTNDSLTYATTESNRRELVDMTFAPYKAAIEQRLSMPDVTPNGTDVQFDLGKFLRGDIKSVMDTAKVAVDGGIMTVDEVRTEWLGLPPMGGNDNASEE